VEDLTKTRIVASIGIIIAIIIIILSIVLLFYYGTISNNMQEMLELNERWAEEYNMTNPYQWMEGLPILVLFIAIIILIFGIEKLIKNIFKFFPSKKQQIDIPRYPQEPPNRYQR